jgi:hypothetical protein
MRNLSLAIRQRLVRWLMSGVHGAGVQSNFIVLDAPIDMGDMGTIIDILVAAAQNTKPPQSAPGKVIIK